MTDQKPLLSGPATPFERRLLEAAREEVPSAELEARMLRVLGPVAVGPATTASPASGTGRFLSPQTALPLVSVGVIVVAAYFAVVGATPPLMDAARPLHGAMGAAAKEILNVRTPQVQSTPFRAQPEKASPLKVSAKAEVDALGDELRLLDQARAALRRGDGKSARSVLSLYAQRHPRGQLRVEAANLRASIKN